MGRHFLYILIVAILLAGCASNKKNDDKTQNSLLTKVFSPNRKAQIYKTCIEGQLLRYKEILTMLLATSNILWPVTGVGLLVVQQATNTELFSGCSVPARPVPGAAGLVAENSVQPVTVLGALGRI